MTDDTTTDTTHGQSLAGLFTCSECDHYERVGDEVGQGECRRYPPKVFPAQSPQGGLAFVSAWPRVRHDNRCGEFEQEDPPADRH